MNIRYFGLMAKYLNLNYFSSQMFKPENLSSDNPIAFKKSYAVIHKTPVDEAREAWKVSRFGVVWLFEVH